jgi:hypothetical protein
LKKREKEEEIAGGIVEEKGKEEIAEFLRKTRRNNGIFFIFLPLIN